MKFARNPENGIYHVLQWNSIYCVIAVILTIIVIIVIVIAIVQKY